MQSFELLSAATWAFKLFQLREVNTGIMKDEIPDGWKEIKLPMTKETEARLELKIQEMQRRNEEELRLYHERNKTLVVEPDSAFTEVAETGTIDINELQQNTSM